MKIYQVGGAVRDKLLQKRPNDCDYVVIGATVAEMQKQGYIQVGKGFPVFLHPATKEEYALARKEIKTGDKHTDFKFVFTPDITLKEDLERRDFTCNAIAYDEENGEYYDYFNGREDIKNKVLRMVNEQHFSEDPLRVLRLCRFAAQLDFSVEAHTLEVCKKMVAGGMLNYLPWERVWAELIKAMRSPDFDKFIELARQIGALKFILPEVDALWQVPEKVKYHPEGNTGGHVLSALKAANGESALVKFGILLHDVGKALTPTEELPSHKKHELRGSELVYQACHRLKAPNRFRLFADMVCLQHMKFHAIAEMRPGSLYDLACSMIIGHTNYVNEYIAVCRADLMSSAHAEEDIAIFEQSAQKLRDAGNIILSAKACDMPNFEELPQDESFKERLRDYKIRLLRDKLAF